VTKLTDYYINFTIILQKSTIYLKPAGDMNALYAQLEEICYTKALTSEDVK